MFMGEYNHTVDPKGRLIIPAKFREQLGDEFVVTKGLDGCLFVYTLEEWHNIEEKFRNISMTSKDARKFSRFFFAGAASCELDKQGRILLPPVLREYANLTKDVVLVGVLSRVEIWDKDRWQENTYDEDEMDEIAEAMKVLEENGAGNISLLHCNTEYPTPYEDVNLLAMKQMRTAFKKQVGYSDHTVGIEVPIAAVALGAEIIEKHFTLDKNMDGLSLIHISEPTRH